MKFFPSKQKSMLLAVFAAFSLQANAHNGVAVSPKLLLSGALESNGLMRDGIRANGLLPNSEPYTGLVHFKHYGDGGGESVTNPAVFQVTGNDAIVDWVVVELRSPGNMAKPVSTHAALLQRDGDVVSTDGVSPVRFLSVAPGEYHVSVRHRNHLGTMTAKPISLSSNATTVDFTSLDLPLYGTHATKEVGNKRMLWLGDTNRDKRCIYQGPNNDIFYLFTYVYSASGNSQSYGNYAAKAYALADLNMDGYATFYGPNNDRSVAFTQVAIYAGVLNYILSEQIPE
ncbi:MAG: hypothetical protein IT258_21240 [Saprospiraceae bacterium]|nr:hypothetical protein [Saprospiraceae bacterium]